ncbi:type II secretion system protein GspD [Megalodesulfovibrio paquesii]
MSRLSAWVILAALAWCMVLGAPLCCENASLPAFAAPASGSGLRMFNFRGTPLAEVLMLFTEATKKNVVATPSIMDTAITLYLENVTPMVALSVLCKNYNFWFNEEDGVIRVMKLEEYGRELMLRRDERTEFFPLKYASCLGVADAIQNIYVDVVEYNEPDDMTSYRHVGTDKLPSIGEGIDSSSGSSSGSSSSSSNRNRNSQQNRNTQRSRTGKDVLEAGNVEMGTQDLGKLRQIVESDGHVTAQDLLEFQVGKTKAQLTVFPRSNAILVRSVDTRLMADIGALIHKLDTPTPQVLLECKILEVSLSDDFESFFDFSWTPEGVLDETAGTITRALPGALGSALGGSSLEESTLRFSYINNTVQAQLELMQKEGRLRSISTPLVYAANNAAARFFQGDTVPVRTGYTVTEATYDADTGRQLTSAQISTDYSLEDLGVLLEVSPSINQDNTVTMKIVANIGMLNQGGGPPFNYNVNNVAQVGETDSVTSTRIEDIILARAGQSLAIGGLIKEKDSDTNKKVPLLGDIPLLGYFFTTKDATHSRSEIIFVLTAHIINHPEEGGPYNQQLMPTLSDHPWYTNGTNHVVQYNATYDELYDLEGRPVQEFWNGKSSKRLIREVQIGG